MRSGSALLPIALFATITLTACTSSVEHPDGPPAAPPAFTQPAPSASPPPIPSATGLPGHAFTLRLSDAHNGFALITDCASGSYACTHQVAVLLNGADWKLRAAPRMPPETGGHSLAAAGPGVGRLSAVLPDGTELAWVTTDAAHSWQEVTADLDQGTVEHIPPGATLTVAGDRVMVLMPDTGAYRELAAQPPLEHLAPPEQLPDGTPWVQGILPGTGSRRIALSRDEGRSWELLPAMPAATDHDEDTEDTEEAQDGPVRRGIREARLVAGPGVLYVFECGSPAVDPLQGGLGSPLLHLYRSTDEGETWRLMWASGAEGSPGSLVGEPFVTADGRLIVYAEDAVYASDDGGLTFSVMREGPPPEVPSLTPAGYLLTDLDNPGHYRISADGFTWRTVILGSNQH